MRSCDWPLPFIPPLGWGEGGGVTPQLRDVFWGGWIAVPVGHLLYKPPQTFHCLLAVMLVGEPGLVACAVIESRVVAFRSCTGRLS